MFDIEWYNNTKHEIEFEDYIADLGYIPIKGCPYDKHIVEMRESLDYLSKSKKQQIVLWKPLRELDIDSCCIQLLSGRFCKDRSKYLENIQYLSSIKQNVYQTGAFHHSKYAIIQTYSQTVGPISYKNTDPKYELNNLLKTDCECCVCMEINSDRYACHICQTITCTRCIKKLKKLKMKCPVCDRNKD